MCPSVMLSSDVETCAVALVASILASKYFFTVLNGTENALSNKLFEKCNFTNF